VDNSPEPIPNLSQRDIDRFWSRISKSDDTDCWTWEGSTFRGGYGQFKAQGRNLKSHRIAYLLYYEVDPMDQFVCHHCDNPLCCNGNHLFLGTNSDNILDSRDKGRLNTASGEKHGSKTKPLNWARGEKINTSKLTAEEVLEIRKLYQDSFHTQEQLAEKFNVTREAISRIILGKSWRHLVRDNERVSLSDAKRKALPGEKNPSAKLTESSVIQILKLRKEGFSAIELASQFGITKGMVYHILSGIAWKHVHKIHTS
jgi:transcriptional regulator with XRE-family HTH domain